MTSQSQQLNNTSTSSSTSNQPVFQVPMNRGPTQPTQDRQQLQQQVGNQNQTRIDNFQPPIRPLKLRIQQKQEEKEEKIIKKIQNNHSIDRCDECKRAMLVTNHVEGTLVCQGCGLVQLSRIIDDSSEWRTFSSETSNGGSNPSRVGGKLNPYLSNHGIDTQVTGKGASEIQKWSDRSSLTAKDKLITQGLRMIKEQAHLLNLKEAAITKASEIYKEIEDRGILKGKSVKGKVAGAIFFASRLVGQPKSLKHILSATEVTVKELNSCLKRIRELFPDERVTITSKDIARQACNRLGLAMDVVYAAEMTAENITNLEIATGRQPQTIAGVAIFIITQLSVDKKSCADIANGVQITEQTIKQAYKDIYEYRHQILPVAWKSKEPIESLIRP